jgi:hypothetical protein
MLQLLKLRGRKDESYSFEHSFEAGDLALKMFLACGCDPVGAYSAIGKGNLPLSLHLALFQKALQRRIERAFFDLKKFVGSLLDVLHKRVAMHGMTLERLKHHHLECSSKQVSLFGFPCECHRPIRSTPSVKQCTKDVNAYDGPISSSATSTPRCAFPPVLGEWSLSKMRLSSTAGYFRFAQTNRPKSLEGGGKELYFLSVGVLFRRQVSASGDDLGRSKAEAKPL